MLDRRPLDRADVRAVNDGGLVGSILDQCERPRTEFTLGRKSGGAADRERSGPQTMDTQARRRCDAENGTIYGSNRRGVRGF